MKTVCLLVLILLNVAVLRQLATIKQDLAYTSAGVLKLRMAVPNAD